MRPIERIIIPCYGPDLWSVRICVASIRYWYPDIPIGLLKDYQDFDTSELESHWQVQVVAQAEHQRSYLNKLAAFYLPGRQRILLLDSDTIFLGPVLDRLAAWDEDFVVEWGGHRALSEEEKIHYAADGFFDLPALRRIFPEYVAPDYFFNTGHLVITSGLLEPEDFQPLLTQTRPPQPVHPKIFLCYDQGVLNFVLAEKQRKGWCSLRPDHFVVWKNSRIAAELSLEKIRRKEGYPMIFHWPGSKTYFKSGFVGGDLLHFYENYYYARIPFRPGKRLYRLWRRHQALYTPRVRRILQLRGVQPDFFKLLKAERNPRRAAEVDANLKLSRAPSPRGDPGSKQ
jgi:hypothetical protein